MVFFANIHIKGGEVFDFILCDWREVVGRGFEA